MTTLIVTGPDNAGKTSIATNFATEYNWIYHKQSVISDPIALTQNMVRTIVRENEYNSQDAPLRIYDRCHYPDDFIYTPVVEGRGSVLALWKPVIEFCLQQLKTIFLYVYASEEVLNLRLQLNGDYYINGNHLRGILKNYQEFINEAPFPIFTIDTTAFPSWLELKGMMETLREEVTGGVKRHGDSYYCTHRLLALN